MKYLNIIILIFISTACLGQSISGKITDKNNNPIPYANVYLKKTNIGTSTDEKGFYQLKNIKKESYTLIISSIGFKTKALKIAFSSDERLTKNFSLLEDNSLDEIVVSGTLRPVSKTASPVPVEIYSETFFKKNPHN